MKESSTYQAILAEGAAAEAKKVLRLLGDDAFGSPDATTATAIEQIEDVARLEDLLKRMRTVSSWQDLFGHPRRGAGEGGGLIELLGQVE